MKNRTLKLVGAKSFGCPALGIMSVQHGKTVKTDDEGAKHLLSLKYTDIAHNEHPLFSEDLDAASEVVSVQKQVPLEQALADDRAQAEERNRNTGGDNLDDLDDSEGDGEGDLDDSEGGDDGETPAAKPRRGGKKRGQQ